MSEADGPKAYSSGCCQPEHGPGTTTGDRTQQHHDEIGSQLAELRLVQTDHLVHNMPSLRDSSPEAQENMKSHRPLSERPIDEHRRMKVICIGAGYSGILTAIRFPQRIPNLDLVIYEKNDDIGGTW